MVASTSMGLVMRKFWIYTPHGTQGIFQSTRIYVSCALPISNLIWMCIWCVLICNHQWWISADEFLSCPPQKRPGVGVRVAVNCLIVCFCWWIFLKHVLTHQVPRVDFFLQRRLGFGGVDYQLAGMWRHAVDLIWLSRNRIAVNSFEVRIDRKSVV